LLSRLLKEVRHRATTGAEQSSVKTPWSTFNYRIREGNSVSTKRLPEYGAFPTDPYSHNSVNMQVHNNLE